MKWNWFKNWGFFYWPVTWQGWTLVLGFVAYLVVEFFHVDGSSHSASDTLIGLFLPYVIGFSTLMVVAGLTSPSGEAK